MTFPKKLRRKRKQLGLTQAELAAVLGVSTEWVSKTERGLSTPLEITQEGAFARLRKLEE